MTSVNERFRQVVNLAGQVSELNTAELECGTLKTSSLLANSIRPRLSNGVVKSVDYSLTSTVAADKVAPDLSGVAPSDKAVILSATMKSTGTVTEGTIALMNGDNDHIIKVTDVSVDATVINSGGVLGQKVTNMYGDIIKISHPAPSTSEFTVSGTITYFEPNE